VADETPLTLQVYSRIAEIGQAEWDSCAGSGNPFVSYAFLSALEDSGSVGRRTGWFARHAVLRDAAGEAVAVAPCYAKANSYGEYVFDHSWAHAYENAGGSYYPKVQIAAPFTPVTGRRLLVARDAPAGARETLIAALRGLRDAVEASSVHVTFASAADAEALGAAGAAELIQERDVNVQQLAQRLDALLADRAHLLAMAEAARALAKPDAAATIADACLEVAA